MLGALQVTVEQVVLNDYAGKCTITETIEVRADKSTAIANHELIPLVHPLSKASNKERARAPVVHNEIITIGENVIKIVRQIEIDNQKVSPSNSLSCPPLHLSFEQACHPPPGRRMGCPPTACGIVCEKPARRPMAE
ncbi:unnamed protein product [Toxocara canis]|uniref:DUF3794 domain-containing protein n=1 Tax=Toxocara canis TaxID=6265 RepID=A0A183U6D0_TOXCA|nr:unnamed protein product [Toxocara canis]